MHWTLLEELGLAPCVLTAFHETALFGHLLSRLPRIPAFLLLLLSILKLSNFRDFCLGVASEVERFLVVCSEYLIHDFVVRPRFWDPSDPEGCLMVLLLTPTRQQLRFVDMRTALFEPIPALDLSNLGFLAVK